MNAVATCLGAWFWVSSIEPRENYNLTMSLKEEKMQPRDNCTKKRNPCTSTSDEKLETSRASNCSTDKDAGVILCRLCHCSESDIRGDAALEFLNIVPPSLELEEIDMNENFNDKLPAKCTVMGDIDKKSSDKASDFVQFVGPEGEIFVCSADVESGSYHNTIFNLGCLCRDDLAYAHYACALKWFINRGCTVCEICGSVAKNVRLTDFRKVVASLKDYEELRNRTVTGEPACVLMEVNSSINPDALAAIRRQRLTEISLWFNLQHNSTTFSQEMVEELPHSPREMVEILINKSALEFVGMLIAICLVLVILLWFIAPRVGKKAAFVGFYFLLGDLCALAVVIFLRLAVPSRFMHGPTRCWAVLFIFCFLAFAIWASRTHSTRAA